jgi:nitrate reductase gamma subunit
MVKLCLTIFLLIIFYTLFFFLVPIWLKYDRKEVNWSTTKNGLADIPLIAAQWLKHFKHQNEVLLNELNVSIFSKYNGNHNRYIENNI